MRILVCVKRVPLTGGKMVLTADEQALETRHLGFTISPHEECGVEEAVRIVEQHGGSSTVLTLGPAEAEEQLRDTLAIGIDRAIHLVTDGADWDPEATADALVEAIRAEQAAGTDPDLIVFGNESADSGNYQVGIRVAHALGRPCVTGLKGVGVHDGRVRCEREAGSGRDVRGARADRHGLDGLAARVAACERQRLERELVGLAARVLHEDEHHHAAPRSPSRSLARGADPCTITPLPAS